MENLTMMNGVEIPIIGFGTYAIKKADVKSALSCAFDAGYRRIDTAWKYKNENAIGEALKSMRIPRDEYFITAKLNLNELYPTINQHRIPKFNFTIRTVKDAFERTCKRLHTDYIDLYILHWIGSTQMWDEVLDLYKEKRIRAVGATYLTEQHIEYVKKKFDIIPMYNQIELSPYNTNEHLIDYCHKNGIVVDGYSCFGTGRNNPLADQNLLNEPILLELCKKYNKSACQIILRWAIQQYVGVIPRSHNKDHIIENIQIFDFSLEQTDMKLISSLNKGIDAWYTPKFQ